MKNLSINSIIVIAALIIGISLIVGSASMTTDKKSDYITIGGQSEVVIKPDKTVIYLSINTQEDTAELTQSTNNEKLGSLKAALQKIGVNEGNIETTNYFLNKRVEWTENGSVDKGYELYHTLKIVVELSKATQVVESAVKNGANGIDRIEYLTTREAQNKAVAQAMTDATLAAKAKAKAVADGLHTRLGRVLKVEEGNWWITTSSETSLEDNVISAEYTSGQILPQKMAVQSNVNVVFAVN